MQLSKSEFVYRRRKNKKKHKSLHSICEKAFNTYHSAVEKGQSSSLNDAGELRRSGRARKAPVLLDSSPNPPKKRQKVVIREDLVNDRKGNSPLEEVDGGDDNWKSRLRSKRIDESVSSAKGKRRLFDDSKDDVENRVDKGNAKVVKSKRHGRVKGFEIVENEDKESDLVGGADENGDAVRVIDKGDELLPGVDAGPVSEKEADALPSGLQLEECDSGVNLENVEENINLETVEENINLETKEEDDNLENREENVGVEELERDLEPDKKDAAETGCANDPTKDGVSDKPVGDEACNKTGSKYNGLHVVNHKSRVKLGRRCGLCGGGTDGKPPKVRLRDGDGSDNGEYSGSSACEEPNYDVWDGFGDDSGWLGRLLGPIKDRYGLAGIWVHQQCAVWSPEVYFAGLGCLKNIRAALYRGRALKCSRCRRPGATTGCRVDRCPRTYHVPCARAKGCIFDHRKFLIACTDHRHLFQPHGIQNAVRLKKMKSKRMKLELRKMSNDAHRKDIEAEEKWLEKCGEDEEFVKRESKRLHRDLCRIAPVYIGGGNSENGTTQFQGWESVAGLQNVIDCMKEVVILPLLYPEFFNNLGLKPPRGVLLHGYPGTGKTLIVRALVGSCARGDKRIAYFARKGADCLGKYVGDAERQLRLLFQVAEKSQPSIIFFDEIDGLAPCRNNQQDQTHSSVVSTLLALMDGLKSRGSVVVIGATNRPDAVDPALRRPGRFDREIYFPLPSLKDREAILSLHTQKWPKPIEGSLLNWVARQTVGFAGADLQALSTQAAMSALKKNFPLQDVLSAAETKPSRSNCLSIPQFSVEERDWLQALSCAPPPCSRREFGAVVNDVIASPLDTFLVPCLLQPLARMLIHLSLNDRVWLPPPLINASRLVKNVVVSAWSSRRRVQQGDMWWLHVDELLQDMNVTDEIEKNLLLAKVLVRQTNVCSSNEIDKEFNNEFSSKSFSSNSQILGASSGLHKTMSYSTTSFQSGFQMLISGTPRSGQRHLASCLLHCFVGNVDIWKVDLASISLEGHGDMVHGLTRILMRCASANCCLIYMPRIDLWAIETYNEASEDHQEESYSIDLQTTGMVNCNGRVETDREAELSPSSGAELKKASCLWTCFINQVESMRVNTSLIILATSELPFSLFPDRVRQFFGDEIMNCNNLSSPLDHKVPRFCVQLDGKFDSDKVMNSFAVKLSKDLTQNFVQSVHNRNHGGENSRKEKNHEKVVHENVSVADDHSKPTPPVCTVNQVASSNKVTKGKSSLVLAISTLGYQLLCYPHFAELCWVTSKVKAGPHANTNGPWKGWPFNSCVIGPPISPTEQVVTASGSNSVKSKEFGVVRGLVAVGLSAYRGEYSSPREICLEVRKVLEALVERVNDKIQAGADKSHFIRLLSQVAYLEDLVTSWAYNLRSLEVESGSISQENQNFSMLSSDNHVLRADGVSECDVNKADDVIMKEGPEIEGLQNTDAKGGGEHFEVTNGENPCINASDEVGITIDKSFQLPVLNHTSPCLTPEAVNLAESAGDGDDGDCGSVRQLVSNGFTESTFEFQTKVAEPHHPLSPPTQVSGGLSSGHSFYGGDNMSSNSPAQENSATGGTDNFNMGDNNSKPSRPLDYSPATTCFHQCCSECFANLHSLLLRIISTEWGLLKGRSVDSTTTTEDVFDFLSSLSVKLNTALFTLLSEDAETLSDSSTCLAEGSKQRNISKCQKCHETDSPSECQDSGKRLMMECRCHTSELSTRNDVNFPHSLAEHSCFVFRNGVLGDGILDAGGTDAPYHCKYQKLCLCFLIEMVGKEQGAF